MKKHKDHVQKLEAQIVVDGKFLKQIRHARVVAPPYIRFL